MYRAYLRLKACPRCGGDIMVDRAIEDAEVCIQCGYRNFKFKRVRRQTHTQDQLKNTATIVKGQANSKATAKA
ncbi:hypothetical protein ACFLXO_02860 [Chloroflexota bacterium]